MTLAIAMALAYIPFVVWMYVQAKIDFAETKGKSQ